MQSSTVAWFVRNDQASFALLMGFTLPPVGVRDRRCVLKGISLVRRLTRHCLPMLRIGARLPHMFRETIFTKIGSPYLDIWVRDEPLENRYGELRRATVLLVDDNDDVRLLMRTLIHRSSTELTVAGEAADGPEALDLFNQLRPHVVVLDYQMPEMDGLTCAREILTIAPDQKLVVFSAHLHQETQAEAETLGVPFLCETQMPELPTRLAEMVA